MGGWQGEIGRLRGLIKQKAMEKIEIADQVGGWGWSLGLSDRLIRPN
jgi:hypothetical protein